VTLVTLDAARVADLERQLEAHRKETSEQLTLVQGELETLEQNDRNAAVAFGELRAEVGKVKADVAVVTADVRVMSTELKMGLAAISSQVGTLSDNVQIPSRYLWPLLVALFGGSILGAGGARQALATIAPKQIEQEAPNVPIQSDGRR